MYSFAKYAFNKSHAAAYAVIAIQTAWLSYYYPVIFLKANLNTYISNPDKLKGYLAYANKAGIKILPPSINDSEQLFTLNEDGTAIRFGLRGIKNLNKLSQSIIDERKIRGKFTSLYNFIERMSKHQKINSRAVESLIYVGALDEFFGTRKSKIELVKEMIETIKFVYGQANIFDLATEFNIVDLSDFVQFEYLSNDEFSKDEKLEKEHEYAGFFITGHPLDDYNFILNNSDIVNISVLTDEENKTVYSKSIVKAGGIIRNLERKQTKKGDALYTFELEDITGRIATVCFSSAYLKNSDKLVEGAKVVICGKYEINDFGPQLIVDTITTLSLSSEHIVGIDLFCNEDINKARQQYIALAKLAKSKPGNIKLNFIRDDKIQPGISNCKLSYETFSEMQDIFGELNCKILWK